MVESGENLTIVEIAAKLGAKRSSVSCIMSRLKLRSNSRMVQDRSEKGAVR